MRASRVTGLLLAVILAVDLVVLSPIAWGQSSAGGGGGGGSSGPIPAGTNQIGSVLADLRVAGSAVASGNPLPITIVGFNAVNIKGRYQVTPDATPNNDFPYFQTDVNGKMISVPSATSTLHVGVAPTVAVGTSIVTGKTSAGNLYGYELTSGGTAGFFVFLNLAAAPASGASISAAMVACIPVAANFYIGRPNQDIPQTYTNGVQVVSSSSCSTYTPLTAAVMNVSVK